MSPDSSTCAGLEFRLSLGRFTHVPYSFSPCAPITCGRNRRGPLWFMQQKNTVGGAVIQILVIKIVDVIVIMKTGRWCTTLPSCWCSNGNHWVPIINVPLENQGGVKVAAVVPHIPNYRSTRRSLFCLPLSPPWVAAIVDFWLGERVGARGYDGNVSDRQTEGCEAQPVVMSTRMHCGRASGEALLQGTDVHLSIKGFCRPHRANRLRCKPCVISVIFMLPLKVTRCAHIWMPRLLFISFHSLNIELSTRMFWGLAVVLHLLCVSLVSIRWIDGLCSWM